MELTYTPSINNFDEDEWTDWMLENVNAVNKSDLSEEEKRKLYCIIRLLIAAMTFENVNAVNKSDLSEEEKRKLYCKIVNKIVDCSYDIRDWED